MSGASDFPRPPLPWQAQAQSRGLRVLAAVADSGNPGCTSFYFGEGYNLLRISPRAGQVQVAEPVAKFSPPGWRTCTSRHRLTSRLVRDGFHALAVLPSGTLVAAVPGAIVTCKAGDNRFRITHRIQRGTRPLHITATPSGKIYWGEYFSNPDRQAVHIYASDDEGEHWNVAYTFPAGTIRHVHNIVWDQFVQRLWILTGDEKDECRVVHASQDLRRLAPARMPYRSRSSVGSSPKRDGMRGGPVCGREH